MRRREYLIHDKTRRKHLPKVYGTRRQAEARLAALMVLDPNGEYEVWARTVSDWEVAEPWRDGQTGSTSSRDTTTTST